uniref:Uncharacterized protein AlNc14C22G2270 n=1 Tax=Albugo laibachii Nc14 TaxID=890382 RepID=F0W5V5_9STRA|nr:conserved hypothetical protein [Albugo laibachii Nc14]|eukprot:CCA16496.1 conserved hypothetical protein [Albugo laibachii Nc14]
MSDREKSPASVNEADDNNEADQEISNPGNNLYVANLAHRVTETELNDLFAKFGRLEKCEVITDPISRESRGFAFVTFEDVRDANDAVQELNGKDIQGRRIRVEHARRKRGHTKTPGRYLGPRLASVKYGRERSGRSRDRGHDDRRSRSRDRDRDRHSRNHSDRGDYHDRRYNGNHGRSNDYDRGHHENRRSRR